MLYAVDTFKPLFCDRFIINKGKAHLILKEALRVKDNNEPLEEISSFYIFIKEDDKWKIKFSSAFFFPK